MKLVVGLGNPGPQYRDTRHNVGFVVADELARRWRVDGWREQQKALVGKVRVGAEAVVLAKPMTFMNLSGESVAGLSNFYKIEPSDLLVVVDEVALPVGRLRARRDGSAGGHNGLKSIIQHLGTPAFPRLRIGVGRGDARRNLADHVLGRFAPDERAEVEAAVLRAAEAVEAFVVDGIERVMSAFNAASDKKDPDAVA